MIFIVAPIAWMVDGWLGTKASLVIQNVILHLINVSGAALVSKGREGSEELGPTTRKTRRDARTPC